MATSSRNIFVVLSVCFLLSLAVGCNAACTNQELSTIYTCISPYDAQFVEALGLNSSTCDRSLLTGDLCTSFANIVTCVNGKDVSDETCRPGATAQIDSQFRIPCKIADFEAACTQAPAINRGGASDNAGCTSQELDSLFTCITPYNAQFFQAIGVDSSTCNRTRITGDLCTSFSSIVTCVNGKDVSDKTCRPRAVGQINPLMQIPCKVEDFEAVCTSAPEINRGRDNAGCTSQELDSLFTCITPSNVQFFQAIGVDSSTCDRTRITGDLCTSFSSIVTCVNGKDVSDKTCRPAAVGQINPLMQIPCKVEDFEAVCTSAPKINRGGDGSGSTILTVTLPLLIVAVIAAVASLGGR